mmetsp:Transcript_18554/g.44443  ORF Transcript_18554/g.44443 Transcript_18554/m.44443 type:complete len:97 (+) Transcript_18554:79-369(+)
MTILMDGELPLACSCIFRSLGRLGGIYAMAFYVYRLQTFWAGDILTVKQWQRTRENKRKSTGAESGNGGHAVVETCMFGRLLPQEFSCSEARSDLK